MSVSERAPGNALGWPTPLACLYSLAMETGIRVRDYPHDDAGPAAIVADGKGIGLSADLADDGLRADVLALALEVAIVMATSRAPSAPPAGPSSSPGTGSLHQPPGSASSRPSWRARAAGTPNPRRLSTTSPRTEATAWRETRPAAGPAAAGTQVCRAALPPPSAAIAEAPAAMWRWSVTWVTW
jgi:hypothetical protein